MNKKIDGHQLSMLIAYLIVLIGAIAGTYFFIKEIILTKDYFSTDKFIFYIIGPLTLIVVTIFIVDTIKKLKN